MNAPSGPRQCNRVLNEGFTCTQHRVITDLEKRWFAAAGAVGATIGQGLASTSVFTFLTDLVQNPQGAVSSGVGILFITVLSVALVERLDETHVWKYFIVGAAAPLIVYRVLVGNVVQQIFG